MSLSPASTVMQGSGSAMLKLGYPLSAHQRIKFVCDVSVFSPNRGWLLFIKKKESLGFQQSLGCCFWLC